MTQRQLGPWRIVEQIGEGGNAKVYRVEHAETRAVAALKEINARKVSREPYQRFLAEIKTHRELRNHAGILPVLDDYIPEQPSTADQPWLVMPIATQLDDALTHADLDEIAAAVGEIAQTLAELRDSNGLAHRDLKPSNLYVLDGKALVGDFGLVTWPDKQVLTQPGQKLGPAHFIAPEMVQDPTQADAGPADVWSLAKVLWVLATGQNYPLPGQFRVDDPRTLLRNYNGHPRAAGLEGILEQATRLDASRRPSMRAFAAELDSWSTPPERPRRPLGVEHLVDQVRAISAPYVKAHEEQESLYREAADMSDRMRAAHRALRPGLESLGRVTPRENQGLILSLGGGSGRRDILLKWDESLTLSPPSQHRVSLTVDVAWELFETWDIHLAAGIWLRGGHLPEVFTIQTRDVRLGTQHGSRAGDELVQILIDVFPEAANRYADLLADAEAEMQQSRQPLLESTGTNYIFRTELEVGSITVIRRADQSVDGHAVAWMDAPLVEIQADGDRLLVRTNTQEGWIERNSRENWALVSAQPRDTAG